MTPVKKAKTVVEPMAHARLSASAAHRWMPCPGSVELSKDMPDHTSAAAAQGTFAHHIAAQCLRGMKHSLTEGFFYSLRPAGWLGNKTIIDGHVIECDQEMVDGVGVYLNDILEDMTLGDRVWIEEDVTPALRMLDSRLGGNSDYIRYRPKTKQLRVRDFKYGAGVFVDADDNVQLKTYALGALLKTGAQCNEVIVTIDQPRIEVGGRTSRDSLFPAAEILEFAADLVDAALAVKPGAAIVPGKKQCSFCPARRSCPELLKQQHALVEMDFNAITGYNVADLAKGLGMIDMVKSRIKALEEFAYAEAERGVEIPGWKLVDKRATRKWIDEAKVAAWAKANAVDPYEAPELKSPAQLEKGLKKPMRDAMAAFVEKRSSGHALVLASDDRPSAKLLTADAFDALPAPAATSTGFAL